MRAVADTLTIAEAAVRAGVTREDMVGLMHRGEVRAVPDQAGLPVVDAESLWGYLAGASAQ